jgi:hypothetical protein
MSTITVIQLWTKTADCCLCGEETEDRFLVGYYCGPTHDEIGSITTEYSDGGIVGGMCACKPCHDDFYAAKEKP